jgi:hypothetical protein
MKSKLVDVERKSDRITRITTVKWVFEEKVLNVIGVYAPQVGCEEKEKEDFTERLMG